MTALIELNHRVLKRLSSTQDCDGLLEAIAKHEKVTNQATAIAQEVCKHDARSGITGCK